MSHVTFGIYLNSLVHTQLMPAACHWRNGYPSPSPSPMFSVCFTEVGAPASLGRLLHQCSMNHTATQGAGFCALGVCQGSFVYSLQNHLLSTYFLVKIQSQQCIKLGKYTEEPLLKADPLHLWLVSSLHLWPITLAYLPQELWLARIHLIPDLSPWELSTHCPLHCLLAVHSYRSYRT